VLSLRLELNSFMLDELHTSQAQAIYPVQFLDIGTSNDSSSSIGKSVYLSLYCTCVDPISVTVFPETTITLCIQLQVMCVRRSEQIICNDTDRLGTVIKRRLLDGHLVLKFTVRDILKNDPWVCITVGPKGSPAVLLMQSNVKIYRKVTN
jgi:hypothetical protein